MKKKTIIILIIIVIICIAVIGLLLMWINHNSKKPIDEDGNFEDADVEFIAKNKIQGVTNRNKYYATKAIMDNYLLYISYLDCIVEEMGIVRTDETNDKEIKQEYKKTGIIALKEMLDNTYIKEFNITDDKIYEQLKKYANRTIEIDKMYMIEKSANINIFSIFGKFNDNGEKFSLIIKTDSSNNTFSIFPSEYMDKYGYNNTDGNASIDIDESDIEVKTYNKFNYRNINDEIMSKNYFSNYKTNMLSNPSTAYDKLDKQYREKRFGNLENYTNYIKENKEELSKITISKYVVNKYDDYTEYVCKDKYDNLYIFKETAIMQYTLTLDTYTLEQPKFNEEYAKANEQKKVMMNIDKFIQMINVRDYKTSYELLSEGFKNNYFKTIQEYEKYMKEKMFTYNNVEYNKFTTLNNTYSYRLTLKDKTGVNLESKSFNIVMKLKEGTDFEISFEK